jgi:hypothetical protein
VEKYARGKGADLKVIRELCSYKLQVLIMLLQNQFVGPAVTVLTLETAH